MKFGNFKSSKFIIENPNQFELKNLLNQNTGRGYFENDIEALDWLKKIFVESTLDLATDPDLLMP